MRRNKFKIRIFLQTIDQNQTWFTDAESADLKKVLAAAYKRGIEDPRKLYESTSMEEVRNQLKLKFLLWICIKT